MCAGRKTEIEIHGYHQERYQEEWTDGRQHSRPQGLEIGSFQGDPLTWKSLQGEKVRIQEVAERSNTTEQRTVSVSQRCMQTSYQTGQRKGMVRVW